MKYIHKIMLASITSLMALTVLAACTSDGTAYNDLGMPEENQIFALPDQVLDSANFYPKVNPKTGYPDAALLDVSKVEGLARKLIVGALGDDVKKIVVTEKRFLIEGYDPTKVFIPFPSKINPETGEAELDDASFASGVGTVIGATVPGAAPFVPLGLYLIGLLSKKRSRQHITNMVKAVIPYDGNIDISGAYLSGKKAIGLEHSSDDPEVLLAVAEKKKAEIVAKETMAKAKNGGASALAAEYDAKKKVA